MMIHVNNIFRLKISTKLWGMVLVALAVLGVIGGVAVTSVRDIQGLGETLYADGSANAKLLASIAQDIERAIGDTHAAPAELDLARLEVTRHEVDANFAAAKQNLNAAIQKGADKNIAASAGKIVAQLDLLGAESKKVFDLVAAFAQSEATSVVNGSLAAAELAMKADLIEFDKIAEGNAAGMVANMRSEVSSVTKFVIVLVGSLVICIAGFGFLVVSSISKPLALLTKAMAELAHGNFAVVLPGLGRKDEIGDVAAAVEMFKVKSAEKADHDARAQSEIDRKTVLARDAATGKVMDDFDQAVGGIVKAAMDGDFAQRVPLEGKEGVILNLAGALNTMCDNIGRVLDDLVGMMGSLAQGDLTRRITAECHGTFATLKDSANTTAERLSEIVSDIKAAATEVANVATEISNSTTDLSGRTEGQASDLEKTSAAMEEISATVKKNAENAQFVDKLTNRTREVADYSGEVVASAVKAMSRIEGSSSKIADIIGVIDEIARQTNLLALNAAVEAARAGDAGRGFAVVASEVRSLAQRSSQAAKEINDLITKSSTEVKEGVELVNQAGKSLGEIVDSIKKVADLVADIATASAEQATGLDQVNRALTQMDEVTQQNSALVEENAATAKTLEIQSAAMSERVGFFRLAAGPSPALEHAPPRLLANQPPRRIAVR
jgi:methyl-accepting chemotaxis protein